MTGLKIRFDTDSWLGKIKHTKMAKKLFVGNLPFTTTNEKLKEVFSKFGEVSEAAVIVNKFSGRSKGFGFVTFTNDADAVKAMTELHDKEYEGRKMTVKEATPFDPNAPRPQRSFGGERRGGFGGGREGGFKRRDSEEGSDDNNGGDFQ